MVFYNDRPDPRTPPGTPGPQTTRNATPTTGAPTTRNTRNATNSTTPTTGATSTTKSTICLKSKLLPICAEKRLISRGYGVILMVIRNPLFFVGIKKRGLRPL